jgi:hypothetical protein
MCGRKKGAAKKAAAEAEQQAMRDEIARLNAETKRIQANTATILAGTEDLKADQIEKVQAKDTAKASTTSLDETLASMGGTAQAISDIQEETFQEVTSANQKEIMETRKRKEQQLQRAVRQRKRSGTMGRRSLITGQYGGRGYRG